MSAPKRTPRMEELSAAFLAAAQTGDHAALQRIVGEMGEEMERIVAAGPLVRHTIVTLYEDRTGSLFIAVDDSPVAWNVTDAHEPAGFESDAVALLDTEDTANWDIPVVPAAALDDPETRAIATYDGRIGSVRAHRDVASGRILAGHAGRHYIGYLEGEA